MNGPLTVGTAGHIDHGKTELVRALTGIDTDRLPEEKSRGITIVLGYAPLILPSGRTVSLVDVPGHERLVRTMVSGASGIDAFLLVVAADDGVMPQTLEHLRVLEALDVRDGVVAITKIDLAPPAAAARAVHELLPDREVVPVSARRSEGIEELRRALDRVAARITSRAAADRPPVLHVDRVFTIKGAGTVCTGTLWSGAIEPGDHLVQLPAGRRVRVRSVQVHDRALTRAEAGQRVAVNLAGAPRESLARGDALVGAGSEVRAVYRVEARLELSGEVVDGERVQVHHGTRDAPGRLRRRGGDWQLRLERPLLAAPGDRLVVRRLSPPDTLGGGVIIAPPSPASAPTLSSAAPAPAAPLSHGALALEERLRSAGHEPPPAVELPSGELGELRAAGRAVRVGRDRYAHPEAIEWVAGLVAGIIEREGQVTLARLRDELSTSRRTAQALLEHLDAARVTRRLPDDSRVLRRAWAERASGSSAP